MKAENKVKIAEELISSLKITDEDIKQDIYLAAIQSESETVEGIKLDILNGVRDVNGCCGNCTGQCTCGKSDPTADIKLENGAMLSELGFHVVEIPEGFSGLIETCVPLSRLFELMTQPE